MKQEKMYEYLGTNGILCTPICLEGIYKIEKVRLTADEGKLLTKDQKVFKQTVIVPKSDVGSWFEV
jgi:hypothetical protein